MSKVTNGPTVVNSGLITYLDAANNKSYDKYENLVTNSEAFNSWPLNNGGGITVTANSEIAPNGTLTADRLSQNSATNATRYLVSNVNVTYASQTYTISCWVRKVSGSDSGGNLYFGFYDDSGRTSIINATSNWERYSWTTTLPASGSATIGIYSDWDINGASNNNIYAVWGFQVELGSSLTDYYPTTTISKTRGTRWFDLSKSGNNGTGIATFRNINNGCFNFNGTNQNTLLPTNFISYPSLTTFTISLWFKSSQSNGGTIFGQEDAVVPNNGYVPVVYLRSDGYIRIEPFWTGSQNNFILSTNTLNNNVWHNVITTYNNGTNILYINSILNSQQTSLSLVGYASSYNYLIGYGISSGRSLGTNYFNGEIANFQFYNRALTQEEITQNYNTIKNRFGL